MRLRPLLALLLACAATVAGLVPASAAAAAPLRLTGTFVPSPLQVTGTPQPVGSTFHFTGTSTAVITGEVVGGVASNELTCVSDADSLRCRGEQVVLSTEPASAGDELYSSVLLRCSLLTFQCSGRQSYRGGTGDFAGARGWVTFEEDAVRRLGTYEALLVR